MREIKTAFRLFEERGKYEQTGKKVSYKTVLTTCPSFLNGGKSEMRFINSIKRELSQKGKNASL